MEFSLKLFKESPQPSYLTASQGSYAKWKWITQVLSASNIRLGFAESYAIHKEACGMARTSFGFSLDFFLIVMPRYSNPESSRECVSGGLHWVPPVEKLLLSSLEDALQVSQISLQVLPQSVRVQICSDYDSRSSWITREVYQCGGLQCVEVVKIIFGNDRNSL